MWKLLVLSLFLLQGCAALDSLKAPGVGARSHSASVRGVQPKYDLQRTEQYKVLVVSDGDTIAVEMEGKRVSVRSACVDAPETGHGDRRPAQPLGYEAKKKYQELINQSGGKVRLNITDSDRYGRKVAEVILSDNATAQEHLALAGLAWPYAQYKQNCPSWDVVKAAGDSARGDRLGVYASSESMPPWEWRRSKWR